MRVLLSGGTGFLGQYFQRELKNQNVAFKNLSRSGEDGIKADLSRWNLNVSEDQIQEGEFDLFVHMGALYSFRKRSREVLGTNVSGTQAALTLARKLKIPRFVNLSSVASVINAEESPIFENHLFVNRVFPDAYSRSKALGEELLQQWADDFESIANVRMGILVGDQRVGTIQRIDGPYYIPEAFRLLKKLIFRNPTILPLPGSQDIELPALPVDAAAQGLFALCSQKNLPKYLNFHFVPKRGISIGEFYQDSLSFFGLGHKKFQLVPKLPLNLETRMARVLTKLPKEEVNHLVLFKKFDRQNTELYLDDQHFPDYSQYKVQFWSGYEKYLQNR
ncbi:MAG: SDR family oxidoreductase [Pseudomonadota bacterium]